MKTPKRFTKPPYQGQKGKCSWCGTEDLPKGRSSWCSQKCVDEYLMRSSSEFIRKKVYERDKGICAKCGCDANAEYRKWQTACQTARRLAERLIRMWENVGQNRHLPHTDEWKYRNEIIRKYAPGNWTGGRNNGWDADHIIPVAEGGGECDLSNYRTLCHPCHKIVTAELAARLAKKRRSEKREQAGDLFPTI